MVIKNKITKLYWNGESPTRKLILSDNSTIESTIEHKFLVKINNKEAIGKKSSELKIEINKNGIIWFFINKSKLWKKLKKSRKVRINKKGEEIGNELYYKFLRSVRKIYFKIRRD